MEDIMKTTIDLKSTILGIAFGIGLFALLGAAGASKEGEQSIARDQIPAGGTAAWVVDTKTGQVWSNINGPGGFFGPKSQ